MADPIPGDPDHAWVDFDAQTVEVDGELLPITQTHQSLTGCLVIAGRGDKWVSLRLLAPN